PTTATDQNKACIVEDNCRCAAASQGEAAPIALDVALHTAPVFPVAGQRIEEIARAITESDKGFDFGTAVLDEALDRLRTLVRPPIFRLRPFTQRAENVNAGDLLIRVAGEMRAIIDAAEARLLIRAEQRISLFSRDRCNGGYGGGDQQSGGRGAQRDVICH